MAALDRPARPDRTGGGQRLSINHPRLLGSLAALDLSGTNIAEVYRWGNTLARDVDAWERRGGGADRGRISKGDANRLLRLQLTKLAGGAL